MPRPSLKAQRSKEILDAFEQCVAKFGIEGATLERIAEEAGLQRSLLRHNVGNRDDLLDALLNRFLEKSTDDMNQLLTAIADETRPNKFIDILFDESYADSKSVLVAEALIAAAPQNPKIVPRLQNWLDDITNVFVKILKNIMPNAKAQDYREVATGIIGIYFNVESLTPLGKLNKLRLPSKKAAMRLINTLQ